MNSIVRENSSILVLFYLFCSFSFITQPVAAQEVLWSHPGVAPQPHITFLRDETKNQQVLISSPFASAVIAINVTTGVEAWTRKFIERIPYSPLALNEDVLVQGDQGTIWTLKNKSGENLWEARTSDHLDFPITSTRFRQGFLFTLGKKAVLRKIDRFGKSVDVKFLQNSWGKRRAKTVPFRSGQGVLSYLDQSGRLNSVDAKTLALKTWRLWDNEPVAARSHGRTREVVAGAASPGQTELWTVELPGYLRSTRLSDNRGLWARKLWKEGEFWSTEGRVLAVPTALKKTDSSAILLVTQDHASLFSPQTGRVLERKELPSKAAASPTYDAQTKTWWLLCERHLLHLESQKRFVTHDLPIEGKGYSMKVKNNLAVIGTVTGTIHGVDVDPKN